MTRERVRQIEAKAVRKLQNPVRSKKLEGFVDLELLQEMAKRAQTRPAENAPEQQVPALEQKPEQQPAAAPSLFDEGWEDVVAEPTIPLLAEEFAA